MSGDGVRDDQYGVDIMAVREIKGWTGVTHLPRQPEYVRGVLNLRGVMVPICCDARCAAPNGSETRKTLPRCSSLSTSMLPPCNLTSS